LTSYFLSEDATWETELNVDNPLGSGGALVRAYVDVLKSLWYGEYSHGPIYTPTRFKQTLADFSPMFSGYDQHDAQELATFLLDGLHEDLNRVVGKKPYIEDLGELKEGPRLVEVADCMLIASCASVLSWPVMRRHLDRHAFPNRDAASLATCCVP
jgi:ubiquitin C-terminal hydrolase